MTDWLELANHICLDPYRTTMKYTEQSYHNEIRELVSDHFSLCWLKADEEIDREIHYCWVQGWNPELAAERMADLIAARFEEANKE